jgi:hypothetical protein
MRRALVLTDEAARHPFRAQLAPHVRKLDRVGARWFEWRITTQDAKDFLLAYCACFLAVSAFIA